MTEAPLALVVTSLAGFVVVFALLGARALDQRRRDQRVPFVVRFPRDLDEAAVRSFFAALTALASPRAGWLGRDSVVLVLLGRRGVLEHRLLLPRSSAAFFVAQLRAAVPGVAITEAPEKDALPAWTAAAEVRLTDQTRALMVPDPAGTCRTILSAASGVGRGECVMWAWVVAGGTPLASDETDGAVASFLPLLTSSTSAQEIAPARLRKGSHGLSRCVLRLAVASESPQRDRALLGRLLRAAGSVSAPGVRLVPRHLPSWLTLRRARALSTPLVAFPVLATPPELLALSAWPLGSPAVPGLTLGTSPQLAPSAAVPSRGRVLGRATAGKGRPVAQPVKGARTHTVLVAPTGSGKSWLCARMALDDLEAGRPVLVLDPKGSLIRLIGDRMSEEAARNTILIDPTDVKRPVPLPLLSPEPGAIPELAADSFVQLLRHRYRDLGPRSSDILSSSLYALASVPGATLMDLLRLWNDARFRAGVRAKVGGDPGLATFFAWFDGLKPDERTFVLAAPMNKLRPLLSRPLVRNVLAAPRATFSFSEALRRGTNVFVSLPEGVLGSDATNLLGQVVLARLWTATQARGGRRSFYSAVVDEAPRFLDQPTDIADVLARSREYGVGLTLVAQSLMQFPERLRETALNSARTKIAFQSSASDARRLAAEFGPIVTPDMLTGLGAFEAIAQVSTGGSVTEPFTFKAEPLGEVIPGRFALLRRTSRKRYGIPRAEIEASLAPPEEPGGIGPVGRRSTS